MTKEPFEKNNLPNDPFNMNREPDELEENFYEKEYEEEYFNMQRNPSEDFFNPYEQDPLYELKEETLHAIDIYIKKGVKETKKKGNTNSIREITAISYLLGKGIDPETAKEIVRTWNLKDKK